MKNAKNAIDINLHPAACSATRDSVGPVAGSVPIGKGLAPRGSQFTLTDPQNKPVPVQTQILGRWPDGSARWVLLDFQAPCTKKQTRYRLEWSGKANSKKLPVKTGAKNIGKADDKPTAKLSIKKAAQPSLSSDKVSLKSIQACADQKSNPASILSLNDWTLDWSLIDSRGKRFVAQTIATEVSPGSGPLRATLSIQGDFLDSSGKRFFSWQLRASAFAGQSLVKLEPMIIVDPAQGVIHKFRSMKLSLKPGSRQTIDPQKIEGVSDGSNSSKIYQVDDQQHMTDAGLKPGHAPGHLRITSVGNALSLALRDFWKRWPKALSLSPESADIELFPAFTAGQFDHMQPDYKFDFLFEGSCYRVKTGQARRWEIWIDAAGHDPAKLQASIDTPAVVLADPVYAMSADVWDQGLPGGEAAATKQVKDYDKWVNVLYDAFIKSQHNQRDYGEMNFGDWFGERHVNWGNNEYDTGYELFFHAARMNNPQMYRNADAAARHASEVDVVHAVNDDLNKSYGDAPPGFPPRPGMMHEHCVGHVGGFHSVDKVRALLVSFSVGQSKNPYLCLDPFNLGHIWTRGITKHYLFTGDPWSKKTVKLMGDSLALLTENDQYTYFSRNDHSGRVAGWTLTALAGAYELDYDKRYLRAMKHIVDLNLSEQDKNSGGWLYKLPWGHCFCTPTKHVGEAGFLTAIRVCGLYHYYKLTGDKRIPQAIQRAVTHLNNDTWKDELSDWRYTSCPASVMIKRLGNILQALAASIDLTNDPEHRRILQKAWDGSMQNPHARSGVGDGKNFTTALTGTAQTVHALAEAKKKSGV